MENSQVVKDDYLSLHSSSCIKGICALIIVISHLKNSTEILSNSLIGKFFGLLAYLAVGVFFFFSGYGISLKFKKSGREYIKAFPLVRMLPLYCTCVFLTIINFVIPIIEFSKISIQYVVCSLLFPGYGIGFGWYIQALFLIYLIFWLVFLCFPKLNRTVGYVIITSICFCLFFFAKPMLWWQSLLGFLLGCLWAEHKKKIDRLLSEKRMYLTILLVVVTIFCVTVLMGNLNSIETMWYSKILKTISVPLFVTAVLLLIKRINVENVVTSFLGEISLEIYCLQMIFMTLFHSKLIYISNDILYWAANLICIIATAWAIHPIVSFINRKTKFKRQEK